jgi:hypothetical protein
MQKSRLYLSNRVRPLHSISSCSQVSHKDIHTELKKDPGVPRLPNLKVRSAEKQRRRSVCPPYRSGTCLRLTLARIPHLSLPHNLT